MSDEAQKAAEKAARKEAKKQAKKAAKAHAVDTAAAQEEKTSTVKDTPADKEASKEKKSKDKKRKQSADADEAAQATTSATTGVHGEEDGQKPSKRSKSDAAAAAATNDADEAKALKKQRKAEKKAAKQSSKEEDVPAETVTTSASASASNVPTPAAADVEEFIKSNNISFEPKDAATSHTPLLAFDQLSVSEDLKKGLANFSKPTPIQSCSWPILLQGQDCIAIAETGSGKTVAFGLPAVKHITSLPKPKKKAPVTVLVLAPTRELAMQTHDNLQLLANPLNLQALCIYGGVPKPAQVDALRKGPRIVVGTPGRILDLCNDEALDLSHVSYLVLDEADRMLDKGFENDIRNIISKCQPTTSAEDSGKVRQTAMFSATWPLSVRKLAGDFMADPVRITVGSDELTASTSVEQHVTVLENGRMKDGELSKVLRDNKIQKSVKAGAKASGVDREKVLVFALYKKECTRVSQYLERGGWQVSCIQGDLGQAQRTQALQNFKDGKTGILVATDVAARGLDIPKVELVVNYTFPLTIEDYIHRIGRTGRAGRKGKSETFFTEEDKTHAGELQRVLKDANQPVPESLSAFGGTIKKKSHATYGDFYREDLAGLKSTKITFD